MFLTNTFARIESDFVFNFVQLHGLKAFLGLDSQAFPGISLERRTASETRGPIHPHRVESFKCGIDSIY